MKYQYYIGIDTGVTTGFCIWNSGGKFLRYLGSMPIHRAMKEVEEWNRFVPGQIFIRIEDARKRKWIPPQKNEKAERGRREGAGSVKRDAQIWEAFLKDLGVAYELVAPNNNKTKVTADYFRKLTGYTERTNEHERDAAMLVFGL